MRSGRNGLPGKADVQTTESINQSTYRLYGDFLKTAEKNCGRPLCLQVRNPQSDRLFLRPSPFISHGLAITRAITESAEYRTTVLIFKRTC
jgi:hypothetical protein